MIPYRYRTHHPRLRALCRMCPQCRGFGHTVNLESFDVEECSLCNPIIVPPRDVLSEIQGMLDPPIFTNIGFTESKPKQPGGLKIFITVAVIATVIALVATR